MALSSHCLQRLNVSFCCESQRASLASGPLKYLCSVQRDGCCPIQRVSMGQQVANEKQMQSVRKSSHSLFLMPASMHSWFPLCNRLTSRETWQSQELNRNGYITQGEREPVFSMLSGDVAMSNQPLHTTHLAPSLEPFAGKLIPSLNLKHATANVVISFTIIARMQIYTNIISIYGLNQTSELPSFVCGTAKLEPVQVPNLPNSSNSSFEIPLFFGTSEFWVSSLFDQDMEDAACRHKITLPTSWRLQSLKEFRAKRAAAAGCQNKSCFRLSKSSWIKQNTACDEEILSNEKLRQKRSHSKEPRPKVQKGKHQAHCSTASVLSWRFKHFLRKLLWLETNHWSRQTRVVLEVSVPCQHQCYKYKCLQFLSDQLQNSALQTATNVFLLCSMFKREAFLSSGKIYIQPACKCTWPREARVKEAASTCFEHLPDKNRWHSLCHVLKHAANALHTCRIHFLPISNQQLEKGKACSSASIMPVTPSRRHAPNKRNTRRGKDCRSTLLVRRMKNW